MPPVELRKAWPMTCCALGVLAAAAEPLTFDTNVTQSSPSTNRPGTTIEVTRGTSLSFDLTPDGRSLVFDLLGQLWILPVDGGKAVALTDAARDSSEDLDPVVSPDGEWVAFRGDRREGRGLWLRSLRDSSMRALTTGAYFANNEHSSPAWAPDSRRLVFRRRSQWRILDVQTGDETPLQPTGVTGPSLQDPSWFPDGTRLIAFALPSGRAWQIDLAKNHATQLEVLTDKVIAPTVSPDGQRVAYFTEQDDTRLVRLWVQRLDAGDRVQVAEGPELSPLRIRWTRDGERLVFVDEGQLWTAPALGGSRRPIPFTATVTLPKAEVPPRGPVFPAPGQVFDVRGFSGLALAPDGERYVMLAVGALWVGRPAGALRRVVDVPSTATGLSWSPDGTEVAWSAGRGGAEDVFITGIDRGQTRRCTALPGSETLATWSPDGRRLAFAHWAKPASAQPPWQPDQGIQIRVVASSCDGVADLGVTKALGPSSPTSVAATA